MEDEVVRESTLLKDLTWKFVRGTFLILVASRLYALLMHLGFVAEYQDPIWGFIGNTYTKLDELFEGNRTTSGTEFTKVPVAEQFKTLGLFSIIVGNLVFGALLKFYSPSRLPESAPPAPAKTEENSKKQQKKQSLLKEVEEKKALAAAPKPRLKPDEQMLQSTILRRNIIITGRLGQCAFLLVKAISGDENHENELVRHIINASLSVGLTLAELNGVKWDGGVLDGVFGKRYRVVEEAKEKVDEIKGDVKVKLR